MDRVLEMLEAWARLRKPESLLGDAFTGDEIAAIGPHHRQSRNVRMSFTEELVEIYATRGFETFEGDRTTTQTSHALQTAAIAEAEAASSELIVAALLHDIGRIINLSDRKITDSGGNARHEEVGRKFLEPHFGPEVTMPIKWHVAAKRYLVATDSTYSEKMTRGSKRSMAGQGGAFLEREARAFIEQPFAREGVALRRWDDRAKLPDAKTPPFEHFVPYLMECAKFK